jgi:hypothetical protein
MFLSWTVRESNSSPSIALSQSNHFRIVRVCYRVNSNLPAFIRRYSGPIFSVSGLSIHSKISKQIPDRLRDKLASLCYTIHGWDVICVASGQREVSRTSRRILGYPSPSCWWQSRLRKDKQRWNACFGQNYWGEECRTHEIRRLHLSSDRSWNNNNNTFTRSGPSGVLTSSDSGP